jgi:hypothetical protein
MRRFVAVCGTLFLAAVAPAEADELCQKKNGALLVRPECVKETPVDRMAVGLVGPAVRAQSPSESFNNDQVLNNGDVPEALQFDEELYDTDGMHPIGSYDAEGSKFTVPIAGFYHVSAGLIWYGGDGTKRQLYLLKNGNRYIAGETIVPQPTGFTIQNGLRRDRPRRRRLCAGLRQPRRLDESRHGSLAGRLLRRRPQLLRDELDRTAALRR